MFATLLIVFREVLEAGLIIGIVLSATHGVEGRKRWITLGIGAGVVGSILVAAFADSIAGLVEGTGQELFNAAVMAIAVVMLTGHNVWMARAGRQMGQDMRLMGNDVAAGRQSLMAMAVVVGVAVLREGSEVALFLYGIALSEGGNGTSMLLGGAMGVAIGGAMSALMYLGLLQIPTRHVFGVTSRLLALLAAGMAAQSVMFLQQAGLVNALSRPVWDTSAVVSDASLLGKTLHSLTGYVDRPNGMQLLVYGATLLVIYALMRLYGHAAPVAKAAPAAATATPADPVMAGAPHVN